MLKSKKRSPSVRILFTDTGRGLLKDARLLQSLLQQMGWNVSLKSVSSNYLTDRFTYYWERLKARLPESLQRLVDRLQMSLGHLRLGRFDLQIHLETSFSTYIGACPENWLIPNQEWAKLHQLQYLPYISRILCKTHAAVEAYKPFNTNVVYLGFSNTVAANLPPLSKDPDRFHRVLHVAGNNRKKGSAAVIEAWRRHPEWPMLDFVIEHPDRFHPFPDNVAVWKSASDSKLNELRARAGLVLAPSEVEGFGHVILEGMAWGSVTLTTDAGPMNELVSLDRGKLVAWFDREPCRLGCRYFVSVDDLEAVINELIQAPASELIGLARNARTWVEHNHQEFETAFKGQLASIGKKNAQIDMLNHSGELNKE